MKTLNRTILKRLLIASSSQATRQLPDLSTIIWVDSPHWLSVPFRGTQAIERQAAVHAGKAPWANLTRATQLFELRQKDFAKV
jgi:hypothetical protein